MLGTIALNAVLFFVIYSPGPAWVEGKPTEQQPLREHGQYMLDLFDAGSMEQAGPFVGIDGGAAVITAASQEAAHALLQADPAVKAGVMVYTLRQWSRQDWQRHSDRRKERIHGGPATHGNPENPAGDGVSRPHQGQPRG